MTAHIVPPQVLKLIYDDEEVIALYNDQCGLVERPNIVECAILVMLVRLSKKVGLKRLPVTSQQAATRTRPRNDPKILPLLWLY